MNCNKCGKFTRQWNTQQKYCKPCAEIVHKEQNKRYYYNVVRPMQEYLNQRNEQLRQLPTEELLSYVKAQLHEEQPGVW